VSKARKSTLERGSVIVISAPSGAGKSTLVRRLRASLSGLTFSVSYTTRSPRPGETDGHDYFFVTPARFKRMIRAGEFVEWAEVFGCLYGTSWKQLRAAEEAGEDIVLDIDVQGHRKVRRRLPGAVSVFVLPPSFRVLERRLRRRRSDSREVIERRLAAARKEIMHWPEYDYLVVNDRLAQATKELRSIVEAARARRDVREGRAREISQTFGG
jgi:guanylate kinase